MKRRAPAEAMTAPASMVFTVHWPEDSLRVVPLPMGCECIFSAPQPFSLTLSGQQVKAVQEADAWAVRHTMVEVTRPEEQVVLWQFAKGVTGRSVVLWLPDAAQVRASGAAQSSFSGVHGVLANLRGTAVQVRAAWGRLESKYDAWLAANLDATGPGDRRVVLPMVGMTVVLGADCLEVGADSVVAFEQVDGSLHWLLVVQGIQFSVQLTLGEGNAIQASWRALTPVGPDVEVWLRPAVDDRSFHQISKAFTGPEKEFPIVLEANDQGFAFQVSGAHRLRVQGTSVFHRDPQWRYCVPLPLEASRGLEDMTDLFTAGDFVWRPAAEAKFELTASVDDDPAPLSKEHESSHETTLPDAMRQAMSLYLSHRQGDLTVIAGFPWFLDWGRDSLMFCRGLIACGRAVEAGQVLHRFGSFEKNGTLPNLLRGAEVTNWETSDAPLWWVVAAGEWIAAGGNKDLECEGRTCIDVMRSIANGYREGTSTGVKLDPESGLVFSPSHHSWMDTDQPCGTPRRGYPIEIQALWVAALNVLGRYDRDRTWAKLARQAEAGIERYFWREEDGYFGDCLHAETAMLPAKKAVADDHLRPNQWLAVALGAVTDMTKARRALEASQCLLVPGGARSLAPRPVEHPLPVAWEGRQLNDPWSPYWARYTGPENVSRKPAYHNGTAWCWLYPVFVEAMVKAWGAGAIQGGRRLMSASAIPWHGGCVGQLPENLDGDLPHLQRGCGAQAWSISEWVRVWALLDLKEA